MKRKFVVKASSTVTADDDIDLEELPDMNEGISDTVDNIADNVEDIQDAVDDIQEDDVNIDIDNNIADHYIAECEKCHGIFISAVLDNENRIEKISGECPICGEKTDQYLKWIIKSARE